MSNRFISLFVLASLAATAAFAAPKKKAAPPADTVADDSNEGATDKNHFEAFLKDQLGRIQEAHNVRMSFFNKERSDWEAFWTKIREERRKFEIRITRQTLDLYESLASVDPKDHPATVANFEKLQGDLIKSFDQHQKQRIQDFFADHETRWKEFAVEQDKERAEFVADAQSTWQQNMPGAKAQDNAPAKTAPKPAAKADDAKNDADSRDAATPPKKNSKKAASSDSDSGSSNDVWH